MCYHVSMNTSINWLRVRYLLGRWFSWREWHYQIRYRFFGLFQRAFRGYSDEDTWNFDAHLARVIAGGLRQLSEQVQGVPVAFSVRGRSFSREQRIWKNWLVKTASEFDRFAKNFPDPNWTASMTGAAAKQRANRYVKEYKHFQTVTLPDFAKHFPSLWN